jgi:arylsulfatase A-like enzyme
VQNIDIAPTFLEVAGLGEVAEMHGRSLLGLMRGQTPQSWRDAIYYHYQEYNEGRISHRVAEHDGVRTDYDKLIRVYRHDAWEYYDLRSDPHELNNRIDDPLVAGRIVQLKQRLREFKQELGDDMGKPLPPEQVED